MTITDTCKCGATFRVSADDTGDLNSLHGTPTTETVTAESNPDGYRCPTCVEARIPGNSKCYKDPDYDKWLLERNLTVKALIATQTAKAYEQGRREQVVNFQAWITQKGNESITRGDLWQYSEAQLDKNPDADR